MSEEKRKWPRAEALDVAAELVRLLVGFCDRISIAGSLRREKPTVGDIELVYIPMLGRRADDLFGSTVPENLTDKVLAALIGVGTLAKRPNVNGSFAWGDKNKLAVHVATGIPVDFFSTTEDCWFNYLTCRTGGADNNVAICNAAIRKGYKWTPYGAGFYRLGHTERMPSERAVFEFVGLPYLEPKDRK